MRYPVSISSHNIRFQNLQASNSLYKSCSCLIIIRKKMALMSATTDLGAKFKGCLVGALAGDCLGGYFEGHHNIPQSMLEGFFFDILEESEPILPYTDDTAMTISVAQSLIENKEICPADLAEKFVNEFFENPSRRYGMNAARIFKNLQESEFEDVFLPAKTSFSGTGSAGNGAAMRVAPIALFAHDKEEEFIRGAVEQCSFITHTHPDGYNGAILMCLAVHSALKLDSSVELDPIQFISDLEDKMKKIETKVDANDAETGPKRKDSTGFRKVIDLFTSRWTAQQEEETPYCSSLKKIKNIFLQKQDNISNEEVAEQLGNNVLALRSVPVAIYSFLKSLKPLRNFESTNPFVRAMYFAISVGGDTDTIASMTGSIAGAYYGIGEIPHNLQRRCEKIDEVVKLADDLLRVSQA